MVPYFAQLLAIVDGNYHAFINKVLARKKTSELVKYIIKGHAAGPLNNSFQSLPVIHSIIHHKGKLWVPLLEKKWSLLGPYTTTSWKDIWVEKNW